MGVRVCIFLNIRKYKRSLHEVETWCSCNTLKTLIHLYAHKTTFKDHILGTYVFAYWNIQTFYCMHILVLRKIISTEFIG